MNKLLLITFAVAAAVPSQAVLFDWENTATGDQTSVSQTVGGLTATASAPPGLLTVLDFSSQSGYGAFGTRCLVGKFANPNRDPLRVTFSSVVGSVTVDYGDNNGDNDGTIFFEAFNSSNVMVGSSSFLLGTDPTPHSISVSGLNISYVVGRSTGTQFPNSIVWDNYSTTAVPEPATLLAMLVGTGAMMLRRRSRS